MGHFLALLFFPSLVKASLKIQRPEWSSDICVSCLKLPEFRLKRRGGCQVKGQSLGVHTGMYQTLSY